jgi:hypothetical protein
VDFKEVVISVESAVPSGNNLPLPRIVAKPGNCLTFTGLTNDTLYVFKVRTRDTSGNLSNGVNVSGTPRVSIPANNKEVGTITATAVAGSDNTVKLTWTSPPGEGYKVAIAWESGDLPSGHSLNVGPIEVAGTESSVEIAELTGGKLYTFRVRTWNTSTSQLSAGNVSPEVSPGPPDNVTVTKTAPGHQSIYLEWTKPVDPRFNSVAISVSPGGSNITSTGTSWNIPGLANNTEYTITLISKGNFGVDAEASSEIKVKAMPFDTLYVKATGSDTAAGNSTYPLKTASEAARRFKAAVSKPAGGTIVIVGTVDAPSPVVIDGNCPPVMTLKGDSTGILQTANAIAGSSYLLTVQDGRQLFLESSLTLKGGGSSYNIQGVLVTGGSKFTLNGGTITRFYNSNVVGGGGVRVQDSEFIMPSGTISDNKADFGGGMYLLRSTFTMTGGIIAYNSAHEFGGVCLNGNTFSMSGTAKISYNNATHYGGVCMSDTTFTMSENAEISGNTVVGNYGGLGLGVNTIFTMSGNAKISGNSTQTGNGGGVFMTVAATFNMNGGIITDNHSNNGAAGGVLSVRGTFNMSAGTISRNTSGGQGGGVHVQEGIFRKTGGTIYGTDGGAEANTTRLNDGAAVFYVDATNTRKHRETTAGTGITLDGATATNWQH